MKLSIELNAEQEKWLEDNRKDRSPSGFIKELFVQRVLSDLVEEALNSTDIPLLARIAEYEAVWQVESGFYRK